MSKRWYAVQAFSGYEKIVQKGLLDRVAQSGHEDLFGDILVPVEEVVEMKSGKKTITERRLYPGYVLVQMDMNDDSWHLVKSTPKVSTFIGGNGQKPTAIKDTEVDIMFITKNNKVIYINDKSDHLFTSVDRNGDRKLKGRVVNMVFTGLSDNSITELLIFFPEIIIYPSPYPSIYGALFFGYNSKSIQKLTFFFFIFSNIQIN